AGGVDDAAQRRPFERRESLNDALLDGKVIDGAGQDPGPALLDGAPRLGDHQRARKTSQGRGEAFDHFVDRGPFAKPLALSHHSMVRATPRRAQRGWDYPFGVS